MNAAEASQLVRRLRTQFAVASLWRAVMVIVITASLVAAMLPALTPSQSRAMWMVCVVTAGCWIIMVLLGFRQARSSNQAAIYIATGRLDLAEKQLREAALGFNLYRRGKLLACHNLAVVAHGRKDFLTAATLSTAVVRLAHGTLRGVSRICRILLADSLLELGDPEAAHVAIHPVRWDDPQIPLEEQLLVLPIWLRCEAAMKRDDDLLADMRHKVKRAELLEAPKASLCHRILSDACARRGLKKAAEFLRRRADLYHQDAASPAASSDEIIPVHDAPQTVAGTGNSLANPDSR